ncbi:MAG: phosphotransferase family protein [Nitrospirota bacterium]
MINETAIRKYLLKTFPDVSRISIRKLGSGVQGSGFLIEMETPEGLRSYVIKALSSEGLGHDYPADRASVFLLDLDEFKNLPKHVQAVDVLSEAYDGSVFPIGGGREYYLLMERAEGRHYFHDLAAFSCKDMPDETDRKKIGTMASYLAKIHALKKDSRTLYWRKLRDTVGHGECLMGVFDTYPEGIIPSDTMAKIIKKSIDWIIKLKPKHKRLSQIHGDFHPGNIWFTDTDDFVLLDRSRGPWGEPADDLTALTVNYIFFSIKDHGDIRGVYRECLNLFFDEYMKLTGDAEIVEVVAPFFAFRGVVVANPVFYPELTREQRDILFRFVQNVLDAKRFDYRRANEYLG